MTCVATLQKIADMLRLVDPFEGFITNPTQSEHWLFALQSKPQFFTFTKFVSFQIISYFLNCYILKNVNLDSSLYVIKIVLYQT